MPERKLPRNHRKQESNIQMEAVHETIARPPRNFVPEELEVNSWADVKPYFEDLMQRPLKNEEDVRQWLSDRSEVSSVVGEEFRWRYVRQTCDTDNKAYKEAFEVFVSELQPELMQVSNALDKKLTESGLLDHLDPQRFKVFLRQLKNNLELYRDENVNLFTELELQAKEYDAMISRMTIDWHGTELTLPQAGKKLQEPDRKVREAAFVRINERRHRDREEIHAILDALLEKRHLVAINAGFENYRDYKMRELGRFDYTVEDCFAFHDAIAHEVVPLVEKLFRRRKARLGLAELRPFDLDVDVSGQSPLNPFSGSEQLIGKSAHCLSEVDPYFAECLRIMQAMGHLDLESRKGKAPGGYNMSMPEIGVPFIFMNAAGTANDVRTMVHEMGHAVHSFLTRNLNLTSTRSLPPRSLNWPLCLWNSLPSTASGYFTLPPKSISVQYTSNWSISWLSCPGRPLSTNSSTGCIPIPVIPGKSAKPSGWPSISSSLPISWTGAGMNPTVISSGRSSCISSMCHSTI